ENGEQQEIAYFSSADQPFTVALLLDVSYSTVFRLADIQAAAMLFIAQLRPEDRVMVVTFDEEPQILCTPTNDRRVLKLAIEAARVGSGTSLYDAVGLAASERLRAIPGRKAVVVLSDGVDTSSKHRTAADILGEFGDDELVVYALRYDTFDDVRKSRRDNAEIRYDDNDRPYVYAPSPKKGEREQDYTAAVAFLDKITERSGGGVFKVSSTNLTSAFNQIAEELRKTYGLGYYPTSERRPGAVYSLKIRIHRPDLLIRTRGRIARKNK
ncbi:MAG: VWA domain-containing protein, partial [Acidobacteria bacterium]|nr:VWA domain-containing protein [Acidobacteriota bacterium]